VSFLSDSTDGALTAAVLAGDSESFSELVRRYQGPLMKAALSRLARVDWAEDAVQETFFCAFKSLHTYDSRFNFRTWLWTILLNQCKRTWQKRLRSPQVNAWSDHTVDEQPLPPPDVSGEVAPLRRLLEVERAERLNLLLAELPEPQADSLRLRFFGGLKFQEIADALDCSLSAAKNRVRLGLTKMAQLIAENAQDLSLPEMLSD